MKVSARNVFPGTVSQVREGAVNAEVTLTLTGGTELVAVVTLDSVKSLELAPGTSAVALVKAPWVMVMSADSGLRLSARNCLAGTVESISDGAVNTEVVIALPGGSRVVAMVTRDAVQELQLAPGVAATAVFKASHVILGVPA
ncbi:TOBE domain-containing protein [Pseudomonas oryzihabitans]|jgi:molybdate transport system regulatory protein|uniref:TOBE domain-containing protein n=1 Tax=Pseudomonas oryzihabitans TaxID=47885 RepID=UPI0025532070|nr:TOBE domain-containing protein [Pseudomonas oryzihabitans]MDK8264685.1 TOBE domain-containing protein [Pseudomonas oryzihabitans]